MAIDDGESGKYFNLLKGDNGRDGNRGIGIGGIGAKGGVAPNISIRISCCGCMGRVTGLLADKFVFKMEPQMKLSTTDRFQTWIQLQSTLGHWRGSSWLGSGLMVGELGSRIKLGVVFVFCAAQIHMHKFQLLFT